MKIKSPYIMNTHTHRPARQCRSGFASILTVVAVGIGLLLILVTMYDDTVESQANQKDHMLRADYQQREEAFLRALTNIIPNKAILCMQDGSIRNTSSLRWNRIYDEALILSNTDQAISPARANALNLDSFRTANSADSNITHSATITTSFGPTSGDISAGTNIAASNSYPPPLRMSVNASTDRFFPIVSFDKFYDSTSTGWVGADVDRYPHYNLVDAPSLHFNYQTGNQMIAKHNWWSFRLSMADNDIGITELRTRTKEYLISLYEIPSQLSVNGASYTTLGTHTDGSSWANFNITGGIFAQRVKTEGSFSSDSISSRKGVELSENTTVNGTVTGTNAGSNPFAGNARELSQSKGQTFPISSASNGGRVAFVPINRGLEFYDRFASNLTNNSSRSTSAVSRTAWDYYSLGAQQCAMRLDIIDVVSASNQTPTAFRITYVNNSNGTSLATETFTKGSNWPDLGSNEGDLFPFHVEISATGIPCIAVYTARLNPFLAKRGADFPEQNRSISINPDYVNNPKIKKPSFPASQDDMALLLLESSDMTTYTKGFSLVTNLRMIVADDVNVVPTSAPAGLTLANGESHFPPISLFAPEKRYGDSTEPLKIELAGQLGSLSSQNDTPVHIGDLKSGGQDEVITDNISADLKPISHPAALPPINALNWMVVIREIHPTFTPVSIANSNGNSNGNNGNGNSNGNANENANSNATGN